MGFPHVFQGESLCLQLLVLMTGYPSIGHMSQIKGGPESVCVTSYDYVTTYSTFIL